MVAVGLLVALYGLVGFPDPGEVADDLSAVINFDICSAAGLGTAVSRIPAQAERPGSARSPWL